MILGTQLPSWKQIIKRGKITDCKAFYENDEVYLLAESCMSINLIANAVRSVKNSDEINIWLPDYFCDQTVYSFREDWMNLIYYTIDGNFEPDWPSIREKIKDIDLDIFIFTHYFGKYHSSISEAKEICKMHGGFLVEDCAHVLYATGKMGGKGDFVIYSPHKQLPIQDGAVLKINRNNANTAVCEEIEKQYNLLPTKGNNNSWYVKKAIQKITSFHRPLTYYPGIHMGNGLERLHQPCKISSDSYSILCTYSYEDFKRIAYIRRDNVSMMNYIIGKLFPDIVPLMDYSTDVPYMAVYSLEKYQDKKKVTDELLKRNFTVLYWPDLPVELKKTEEHKAAFDFSENIITLPIHQGITPQKLIKKFPINQKIRRSNKDLNVLLKWTNDKSKYENIYRKVIFSNIPQDWDYGDMKAQAEQCKPYRAIVIVDGKSAGVLQVLIKKKAGLNIAIRINRGPLLFEEYDNPFIHAKVIKQVKEKFHRPVFCAVEIENTPENLSLLTQEGFRQWNPYGFESGVINLQNGDVSKIRKSLNSKWRNQLVTAEKKIDEIKKGFERFDEILDIYKMEQDEKGFEGIPRKILELMKNDGKIEISYIENDGVIAAFDVFYVNNNFGLYLVGWNGSSGRRVYANNLLLYDETISLINRGVKWMDLGGIDYIDTEENARFKDGMNPVHYRLLGEFVV